MDLVETTTNSEVEEAGEHQQLSPLLVAPDVPAFAAAVAAAAVDDHVSRWPPAADSEARMLRAPQLALGWHL